jgi:hypothetical protein
MTDLADRLMSRAAREVALRLDGFSRQGEKLGEMVHLQPETRAALRRLQPDPVDHVEETLPLPIGVRDRRGSTL